MTHRLLLVLILAATGCPSRTPDTSGRASPFTDCHRAADLGPGGHTIVDAAPTHGTPDARIATPDLIDTGCSQTFIASPIAMSSDWLDAQRAAGTCAAPPAVALDTCASAGELYASCTGVGYVPDWCGVEVGMQFCDGLGVWTSVCRTDADCPFAQERCVIGDGLNAPYGACQVTCAADVDCGRCDLACEGGVCTTRPGPVVDDCCFTPDAGHWDWDAAPSPDASPIDAAP